MSKPRQHSKKPGANKIATGPGKRGRKRKGMCLEDRPILGGNAAGIDIGAREIYVAVPPDRDAHPVRVFSTFTEDLEEMAQWLVSCGVATVAMESTGVFWIPPYDVLERHGVKPCLVDARGMKNVPGRRTDWHECQWLQFRHSVGLLRAAFRPDRDVCAVRSLMRHRSNLVEMTSQHIQHMHKALTPMNVRIHHVIGDITGLTGLAVVDAILAGQRDPVDFDLRTESYKLFGVDLTQILGVMAMVLTLFSELGRDMSRWNGGTLCVLAGLFRMAAYSLHRDQSQLGDTERERRFEARLKRQAQQLGYKLVPIEERPAA
jgi:hypothetical protein